MSLATPRPRNLNGSTATSASRCPPSPPPPVFSVTSAFFESPFSVSANHSHQPHPRSLSNSPAECMMTTSEPSRSSLGAGFALQQVLIAEEQQPHQPETAGHGRDGVDWRASEEWTPLSRRSSVAAGSISARQQTPAQPVDRLDRLLAEMEGSSSPPPPASITTTLSSDSPSLASSSSLLDCWELHSLETRFHPVHHTASSSSSSSASKNNSPLIPLRPCLKNRSTSVSSLDYSSSSSNTRSSTNRSSSSSASSSSQCSGTEEEEEEEEREEDGSQNSDSASESALHSPPLDADEIEDGDRTIRVVRFDDDSVEEFLTWSRESYDRKGPLPITKLNLREVIELKLIKEELGISPASVSISPSSSSASSNSSNSRPSSS
ncbi:hypothetical protein PGT21_012468 [Puccinia graminis f. sp. tritici]|uniref:Uncharacterized protein n=1 Tax=Puccinia graminis f. sp. tritici TaxID=56615 RepID=A0A5B0QI02_PUCGR|nr:hypothetical protein PGT21_012468 [Puccinia graminis f. sp. tritici]